MLIKKLIGTNDDKRIVEAFMRSEIAEEAKKRRYPESVIKSAFLELVILKRYQYLKLFSINFFSVFA